MARLLNRPGTHGQRKSIETKRSLSVVWWLQYAGKDRTLPVNPLRPGRFCRPNPGRRKPQKSSWNPESRERSAENGATANGKGLRIFWWLPGRCHLSRSASFASRRADIRGSKCVRQWRPKWEVSRTATVIRLAHPVACHQTSTNPRVL